ncbi:MAG TPA: hypothetical protein VGJ28_10815 [Micromonosporaceae bacterium]
MRKPSARWLVPLSITAIILGTVAATTVIKASAGASLAPRTPAQLLADAQTATVGSAIGTLVEHADLDIPALPAGVGGDGSAQFDSLITGSHTLRLWYDGALRERLALIGTLGESDIIRNGADLWIWSSNGNKVTHVKVPTAPTGAAKPAPSAMALTPSAIATALLGKLSPSTSITSGHNTTVAGRAAYTLMIAPKDPASLVGSIRIAIDAQRHLPLRVQVFPVGSTKAAFEIGFTEINFVTPDPGTFDFNPPPHPTSTPLGPALGGLGSMSSSGAGPTMIGSGWTAIAAGPMPFVDNGPGGQGDSAIDAIAKALPTVNGPWGTGKLLRTKLFSALLVSDRIYIGAVTSNSLLAAVTNALAK